MNFCFLFLSSAFTRKGREMELELMYESDIRISDAKRDRQKKFAFALQRE